MEKNSKVYGHTKGDLLSIEELKKIGEYTEKLAMAGTEREVRNAILVRLLLTTGRRIGEILAIKVGNVDFEDRIVVTDIEKRKREVVRPISIDEKTMLLIQKYVNSKKLSKRAKLLDLTVRHARRIVQDIAKKCGIEKWVTPHSFRHSLVTYLRASGWSDLDVIKVTGHKSVSSLRNYDHTTFYDVRDRFEELRNKILGE